MALAPYWKTGILSRARTRAISQPPTHPHVGRAKSESAVGRRQHPRRGWTHTAPTGGMSGDGPGVTSEILRRLRNDAVVHGVQHIDAAEVTPVRFYREYVCGRVPCVIRGMTESWRARFAWCHEYLAEAMGTEEITVAVTPNGRADAVTRVEVGGVSTQMFLRPDEQRMPMREFVGRLRASQEDSGAAIPYLQKQNDSFREEFQRLAGDIGNEVEAFGTEVFGAPPEAVNFWMGGNRTVSSMHKDPYENLYAVVRGVKTFILLPPWEAVTLPYITYPEGIWRQHAGEKTGSCGGGFTIEPLDSSVNWIPIDPSDIDAARVEYPALKDAHPLSVEVAAGDVLYLPSLWYHQVGQRGDPATADATTIAVNYWFDINYNTNYWMLESVRRMTEAAKGHPLSDDEDGF